MIKAIETRYKGYRFRSRLEARWAVFFDALGVKWEYEKEGYDLGATGWYLPDFWLPEQDCWFEVKGVADNESLDKMAGLCAQSRKEVHAGGEIDIDQDILTHVPIGDDKPVPMDWILNFLQPEILVASKPGTEESHQQKDIHELLTMLFVDPDIGFIEFDFKGIPLIFDAKGFALGGSTWMECASCHKIFIHTKPISWHLPCNCGKGSISQRIKNAYAAARSARFEHGAQG